MGASTSSYLRICPKKDIRDLSVAAAEDAVAKLNPVTFEYKTMPDRHHVGFIAEDVPELVATKDRKGLSPMDVVAVLTKVVQQQQVVLAHQQALLEKQQRAVANLETEVAKLELPARTSIAQH